MTTTPIISTCPTCGRPVQFSNATNNILVCGCNTVLNRMENGTIIPRPFHLIKDKASFIAPGTIGTWMGQQFTVTGRFRIWLEEVVISYWTIFLAGGQMAYLTEGYGTYTILLPQDTPAEPILSNTLQPMTTTQLYGMTYLLEKKNQCERWEVEGELYMPEAGNKFTVLEFSSFEGDRLHVIEYWPKFSRSYRVLYTDFKSLDLQETRAYVNEGQTITCKCSNRIHVSTYPFAQSAGCENCGRMYSLNEDRNFRATLLEPVDGPAMGFYLSIGVTGILYGISYKVIGRVEKFQTDNNAQWREYVLFSEQEGYAFLSEYNGHWIYVRESGEGPVAEDLDTVDSFVYERVTFRQYNEYEAQPLRAEGEFPGNLFSTLRVMCREFIAPPDMWILEQQEKEGMVWLRGKHISRRELTAGFGDAIILPATEGVGAVQPPGRKILPQLGIYTACAILFLIIVNYFTSFSVTNKTLVDKQLYFPSGVNVQQTVIKDLILDKNSSVVKMAVSSNVNNSWVDVKATLTEFTKGTQYQLSNNISKYSGSNGGENWSKGSQSNAAYFSEIPAGLYTLQLDATREATNHADDSYNVTLIYNVPAPSNLGFCIFLLLIWPAVQLFRILINESKRWSDDA
jgi:hypothetical protein